MRQKEEKEGNQVSGVLKPLSESSMMAWNQRQQQQQGAQQQQGSQSQNAGEGGFGDQTGGGDTRGGGGVDVF